jgi:hypothetical protein
MLSKPLLTLAIVLLVALPGSCQSPAPKPAVDWIRTHAIPLKTVEAGHGFEDMEPLRAVVGSARVVELGEATHGSREFFQLKHRMLEFLATQMGFTIFTIEANMPEAYRLNDYVLTGKGDPAALLRGMYFWTWDTEEVLSMIHWMREFNTSGKGRVQFTGFDMQTTRVAAQIVADFVKANDESYWPVVTSAAQQANRAENTQQGGNAFGVLTATFPVEVARGKKIRYSGAIKTSGVTQGYAGLWWRADGKNGVVAFNNMQDQNIHGDTDWKRYSLELTVPETAININFGLLHPGNGTAWFDDLKIRSRWETIHRLELRPQLRKGSWRLRRRSRLSGGSRRLREIARRA